MVLVVGILAARSMLFTPGLYYNMHDDLQMMRQLQLEKCFVDGQIPCRWVPDMGYGFGFPLFNFYPPLPYLTGEVVRLFGFSFVATAKTLFALALILSGVGMYVLAREFFGRLGGILSAVFYVWAPYHAVDVFVRGAMNEAWGLTWFPFILWAGYKLIKAKKTDIVRWIVVLALAWVALLTSHNLMVLIFGPVFLAWSAFFLWQDRSWGKIKDFIFAGSLSFGLAAFFTIPAVFENSLTQLSGQLVGYYDYTAHFVNLKQLFVSRFWGDGPSVWGAEDDGMSFQVGHVHWVGSLILLVLLLWPFKKANLRKLAAQIKKSQWLGPVVLMTVVAWAAVFMTHTRSTPIWQLIPQLGYLQFSWRFLTLVILGLSFAMGALVMFIRNTKHKCLFVFVLSAGLIAFNWDYFKPVWMGPVTDEQKFSDVAWDLQQTAGIYDYLPKTAVTAPKEPQKLLGEVMQGEATVSGELQGTNWAEFDIAVASESAQVRLGIFQFPDWQVYVDGREVPNYLADDEMWGRMYVDVPAGEHTVRAELHNTPVRTVSNYISLVSLACLVTFPLWRKEVKLGK